MMLYFIDILGYSLVYLGPEHFSLNYLKHYFSHYFPLEYFSVNMSRNGFYLSVPIDHAYT